MPHFFLFFLIYSSKKFTASGEVFVLDSHLSYPSQLFSKGALLGGDLNNSNGGCPSPVREYSWICSNHNFPFLCCVFFLLLLPPNVLLLSGQSWSISKVLPLFSSSSAPSVIVPWRDQGMPPVTSTEIHGIPSHTLEQIVWFIDLPLLHMVVLNFSPIFLLYLHRKMFLHT